MMIKKYSLLLAVLLHAGTVSSSNPSDSLHEDILEAQNEHVQHMKLLAKTAATFFNPQPLYATTSSQEQLVTTFYGSSGLQVGEPVLGYIKNFYFYLDYLTKIEYAARLVAKAKQAGTPYVEIIRTYGWQKLMDELKVTSYTAVGSNEPAWQDVQPCIVATMNHEVTKPSRSLWQDLTTTSFWTALKVTAADNQKTIFWQNYLKFTIGNSFDLDLNFLFSRYESEKAIFKYLPNMEIAYFHPDFTQLRTSSELASIALIVNEHKRNRLLSQTNDWKTFITKNGIDVPALIEAVTTFSSTPFATITKSITTLTTNPRKPIALQPPGQEQLICLTMIIILQTFLADAFKMEKLDDTMQKIKKLPQPQPSILPYAYQDYPYLYELNLIKNEIATAAKDNQEQEQRQSSAGSAAALVLQPSKTNPQVVVQSFADWLSQRGTDVWNIIKSTGEAIYATAKDVDAIIDDETKTIYYSSGLASLLQQVPPDQAQQLAKAAQAAASGDFASFRKDTKNLLEGVVKLGTYPGDFAIEAVLTGIGHLLNDPALAKDFQGYWSALIDTAAEVLATPIQMGSIAVEAGLKLSTDGIHMISQVVVDVFTGQNVGSDIVQGFKQLAYDVVGGVLAGVTFTIGKLKEELADIMKACGYLVKLLTDLVIDIGADITAIGKYLYLQTVDPGSVDLGDLYKQQQAALGEHRRFIAQIVTATLIIIGSAAFTVATGGTGLPLVLALVGGGAFNAGFGVFMGMTGYQADQEVALLKQEQHDYVETFSVWTRNKEAIIQAQQEATINELDKKFSAEITNQERSLGFLQNFLNNKFKGVAEQESVVLGSYQAALLTPDPTTKAVFADIGSTYGYHTGLLDLNPSQGFAIFSPARQKASQEIAEFPRAFVTQGDTTQSFWYKQRVIKDLAQSPDQELVVDLRVQALYVVSSFYLGVSLGGKPLDKNKILQEQTADIAQDHLCKMMVFKRTQAQGQVTFGIYEHEGLGWITNSMNSPAFDVGIWYRIKATLAGTTLRVKVWKEGDREPDWSTFAVSATNQQTIGVVFSGASIEWEMITPSQKTDLQPLPALYKPYQGPIEKDREEKALATLNDLKIRRFGTIALQTADFIELLKNNYIYTTTMTNLAKDTNNALTKDYLIFGTSDSAQPTKIITAGLAPTASPTSLISLVSGNIVDQSGQTQGMWPEAWTSYQATHRINDNLVRTIMSERELYAEKLAGPYTFGLFTLTATSAADIAAGQYIYTTKEGDYVLMANLDANNNVIVAGMAYAPMINAILSLVSGNVYIKNSTQPVNSGYQDQLATYQQAHGPLRKDLLAALEQAQKKYAAQQQPSTQKKPLPLTKPTEQPIIVPTPPKTSTGGQIVTGPPVTPPSSLTGRQQEASQEDWS